LTKVLDLVDGRVRGYGSETGSMDCYGQSKTESKNESISSLISYRNPTVKINEFFENKL
jgi:hypothetical protein